MDVVNGYKYHILCLFSAAIMCSLQRSNEEQSAGNRWWGYCGGVRDIVVVWGILWWCEGYCGGARDIVVVWGILWWCEGCCGGVRDIGVVWGILCWRVENCGGEMLLPVYKQSPHRNMGPDCAEGTIMAAHF